MSIRVCAVRIAAVLFLLAFAAPGALAAEVVAVFNFAQRDDNPQYAWLSKGLADLLINQLADLPDLTVVSRDRMQMILNDLDAAALKEPDQVYRSCVGAAAGLHAGRMIFGTYAVRGGRAFLSAQVINLADEGKVFETSVEGLPEKILDLEGELAGRLRAYFLGQHPEKADARSVPHWTSNVAAAEDLYGGVHLFDQGRYPEAWLRFRQAARADPGYADAVYWQARMFYSLLLYESAGPLFHDFLRRWPDHPRAGDAALELVDSARQTLADPLALEAVCRDVRARTSARALVYNRDAYGVMLLHDYLDRLIAKNLLSRSEWDAAAQLAMDVQYRVPPAGSLPAGIWQDIGEQQLDSYATFARGAALLRYLHTDRLTLRPGMCSQHVYQFDAPGPMEASITTRRFFGDSPLPTFCARSGDRYVLPGRCPGHVCLVAPEGYSFKNASFTVVPYHVEGDPPVLASLHVTMWLYGDAAWGHLETDKPPKTFQVVPLHRCRFLILCCYMRLIDPMTTLDRPTHDSVKEVRIDVGFQKLEDAAGAIRVRSQSTDNQLIYLDGRYALRGEGLIRGVTPGAHVVRVLPEALSTGKNVYVSRDSPVNVPAAGTVDLEVRPDFNPALNPAGFTEARRLPCDYPEYMLPPRSNVSETSAPCLLRAKRGTMQGYVVAAWSYREDLWFSLSRDDGRTWSAAMRFPIPVNTAHVERAPWLLEDEQGRICLVFLSDRNMQRFSTPYVAWTHDLQRWSPAVRIAEIYADDVRILQGRSGQYLVLLPPPATRLSSQAQWQDARDEKGELVISAQPNILGGQIARLKYGRSQPALLVSRDLVNWQARLIDWESSSVSRVHLLETADGLLHAFYTEQVCETPPLYDCALFWRQSSDGGLTWSAKRRVLYHSRSTYSNLSVVSDGRSFYGATSAGTALPYLFEIDAEGRVYRHDYTGLTSHRQAIFYDPTDRLLRIITMTDEESHNTLEPMPGAVFVLSCTPADKKLSTAPPINGVNPYWYDPMRKKLYKDLVPQ